MVSVKSLLVLTIIFTASYIILYHYLTNVSFVEGNSMEPTFTGCTFVYIDNEFEPSLIEKDDIVLVDLRGLENKITEYDIIVHRVVINNNQTMKIATRGDNDEIYNYTTQVDGFFDYNRVMGKVDKYYNLPVQVCEIRNYPRILLSRFF